MITHRLRGRNLTVAVDATDDDVTVILPPFSTKGFPVRLIRTDSSGNSITVISWVGDSISTLPVGKTYEFSPAVDTDGQPTSWYVTNKYPPATGPGGEAFPVGSIFIAVVGDNPADLLGYGTWSEFGTGRILVGIDSGNPDFDTLEETGGSLDGTPSGAISAPTFTGDALGTHSHGTGTYATSAHAGSAVADHAAHTHSVTSNVSVDNHAAHTHSVTSNVTVDNHASHTHTYTEVPNHVHVQNMPSAFTGGSAYMATDTSVNGSTASYLSTANPTGGVATGTTAGPNATLTHTVTNNAVTSGNPSATLTHTVNNPAVTSGDPSITLTHSVTQPDNHTLSGASEAVSAGTPSGTISTPTFTGDSMSVVQPYIVVKMWKRTA